MSALHGGTITVGGVPWCEMGTLSLALSCLFSSIFVHCTCKAPGWVSHTHAWRRDSSRHCLAATLHPAVLRG